MFCRHASEWSPHRLALPAGATAPEHGPKHNAHRPAAKAMTPCDLVVGCAGRIDHRSPTACFHRHRTLTLSLRRPRKPLVAGNDWAWAKVAVCLAFRC